MGPALKIITKAIITETVGNFLAVLVVLLLILVGGLFVRLLGKVADGTLDAAILFPSLLWVSLQSVTSLLAVAMFLALLLTLGRLYKDNEIYALRACGYGEVQLLAPALGFGAGVALLLVGLAFWASPWAHAKARALKDEAMQSVDLGGVVPGRFMSFPAQQRVIYAEALDADTRELRNVYIFQEREGALRVVAASRARQKMPSDGEKFLELADGQMVEIGPGGQRLSRVDFALNGFRLPSAAVGDYGGGTDTLSLVELASSPDRRMQAELHWRLSFPLSVLVLAFIAVPLSHGSPRQGRFGKLAVAVMVYILYANLLGLGKSMVEDGQVPSALGLWWVHGVFFALGAAILWQRLGRPLRAFVGG